jgi:hypothetical protein
MRVGASKPANYMQTENILKTGGLDTGFALLDHRGKC